MSIKPILFNTEMVRSILNGRKTQTRRAVKEFAGEEILSVIAPDGVFVGKYGKDGWLGNLPDRDDGNTYCIEAKPPCKAGDILWVRETWAKYKNGGRFIYRADADGRDAAAHYNEYANREARWRPSIHMPREAARIFLRVTDVRVERLNDISQVDAINEGALSCDLCETAKYKAELGKSKKEGTKPPLGYSPKERFAALWDSTIKKDNLDQYGWNANPWVWVIEFERCEKPEGWL